MAGSCDVVETGDAELQESPTIHALDLAEIGVSEQDAAELTGSANNSINGIVKTVEDRSQNDYTVPDKTDMSSIHLYLRREISTGHAELRSTVEAISAGLFYYRKLHIYLEKPQKILGISIGIIGNLQPVAKAEEKEFFEGAMGKYSFVAISLAEQDYFPRFEEVQCLVVKKIERSDREDRVGVAIFKVY